MQKMNQIEKLEYWKMIIDEFENSGKPIGKQCKSNGIATSIYYTWRRKIKGRSPRVTKKTKNVNEPAFIEASETSKSKKTGVFIQISEELRIGVEENFNSQVLISVIKTLNGKL